MGIVGIQNWMDGNSRFKNQPNKMASIIPSHYSQKRYYVINVKAKCDKKKRTLFCSVVISRGAEHNYTAFQNSGLYNG
jgi:hypothetical protein